MAVLRFDILFFFSISLKMGLHMQIDYARTQLMCAPGCCTQIKRFKCVFNRAIFKNKPESQRSNREHPVTFKINPHKRNKCLCVRERKTMRDLQFHPVFLSCDNTHSFSSCWSQKNTLSSHPSPLSLSSSLPNAN